MAKAGGEGGVRGDGGEGAGDGYIWVWVMDIDEDRLKELCKKALMGLITYLKVRGQIAALKDDDPHVQWRAVEALRKIGQPAVKPLIAALKDNDSSVREGAAEALGKIGDARAVEPLIAALKDNDLHVRERAAEALEEIGWKPSNLTEQASYLIGTKKWDDIVKIGQPAVEPLIAALKVNDSYVSMRAAEALGKIGQPAVEPLIAALKDEDNDSDVRQKAAEALEEIGWKPSNLTEQVSYLIAAQEWDDIVKIGQPAVKPLIAALKDNDSDVRQKAAIALEEIGWKPSNLTEQVSYLIAAHEWDDIVKIGQPAVKPLIAALNWGVGGCRRECGTSAGGDRGCQGSKAIDCCPDLLCL